MRQGVKLLIAGSRSVTDVEMVRAAVRAAGVLPSQTSEIVSGTARGVDQLGEQLAQQHGVPVKRFPADWDMWGKSAGYRRNAEMAKYADILVAVWDGHSKGTGHMIDLMNKENKPVYIYAV